MELGGTGSTPPLTAQDLGLEVVYLAASQPRPANGAILRRKDEAEVALAGLKGCRIALVEGSFHTYLLAHLAERAGLG
ncbi:aliphatic sulfonate ABC transporter substrate-binding protein, partial [Cupriavidus sp. 2MCAB6]